MTADARDLGEAFKDGAYDVVVDKATLDSILCGDGSTENMVKALSEVQRILKPGGIFVSVTHGTPDSRAFYFKHPKLADWDLKYEKCPKDSVSLEPGESKFFHTVFICQK